MTALNQYQRLEAVGIWRETPQAKARLLPAVAEGNLEKVKAAPVTAILAYDLSFVDKLPKLHSFRDMRPLFEGKSDLVHTTAFRNATLQAGYFILAARALGLDCGPLSGFSSVQVDAEFFPDGRIKSNFLCNIGYGDRSSLFQRLPRLTFDEACELL